MEALDAQPVDGRIGGADAETSLRLFLDDDVERQHAIIADAAGRLDPHGAEHVEPRQPLFRPRDIVGVVVRPGDQPGLLRHEIRIHARRAGNPDGPDRRMPSRRHRDGDIDGLAGMIGNHLPVDHRRLGITLLAPGIDSQLLGAPDHGGLGHEAGAEPGDLRLFDLIARLGSERRPVGDLDRTEAEQRAGIDFQHHRYGIGQIGIGRQVRRLLAADEDADRPAIVTLVVERGENPPIVAARLGQEPRRAGRRSPLVGKQRRGAANGIGHVAGRRGFDRRRIGLRIADHRIGVDLALILEQLDAEELECRGPRHQQWR